MGIGIRAGLALAALAAVGLVLLALVLRKARAGKAPRRSGAPGPAGGAADSLAASLRRESEIVASSFEEDALVLMVLEQLDQGAFGGAVWSIRSSLGCSSEDAGLLARELERTARRVRAAGAGQP
jgi:hypothetical protein